MAVERDIALFDRNSDTTDESKQQNTVKSLRYHGSNSIRPVWKEWRHKNIKKQEKENGEKKRSVRSGRGASLRTTACSPNFFLPSP